jgi:predicted dehydrogenase
MANRLRWALLSTAAINEALIGPLRRAARSELVAVASRDLARGQAYAHKWGIPHVYGSYEEMLADPGIDVVYNSLPNAMHAEWSAKAAAAGKHVLCEKPMAQTLDEIALLEAAARDNRVTIFEAFMYLHHPQTRRVVQMIGKGAIGRLQTVHAWFHFHLPPADAQNVRLQTGLAGGGAWDVGVYPNSYTIVAAGGRAPEEVWAQQIVGESGVDVAMRAQMRFAGGVTAQVSSGFRTPFREGAWFVGDEGILQVPEPWKPGHTGNPSRVLLTRLDDRVEEIAFEAADPYDFEVAAMEACVLDGAEPVVPLQLSREFTRTMLAVYRSAATGQVERP